jgi:GNAT superfamily N-acetyltransferase
MTKNSRVALHRTDSRDRDFQYLSLLMDNDLRKRYGLLQSVYDDLNIIGDLDTVLIAYLDQTPVGCGCFRKFSDNTIEVKRMFVEPVHRGHGVATQILAALEEWAKEKGFNHAILETGHKQPEAIHLYERSGYAITINYGPYAALDNSVCMRKKL